MPSTPRRAPSLRLEKVSSPCLSIMASASSAMRCGLRGPCRLERGTFSRALYNEVMFFAITPEPPYWAVIFTSVRSEADAAGYGQTAAEMEALAAQQPGYLGIEHAGGADGAITVSYWRSLEDIAAWRRHADHLAAQRAGRERWYRGYVLRVA